MLYSVAGQILRKLVSVRLVIVLFAVLASASSAYADPVTFATTGTFTCGGCSGSGTNSVTFLGGLGNAVMITFTGLGNTNLNMPTGTSLGNFQTFFSGNGPINISGTFTLNVIQTVPGTFANSFTATFNGGFSASNSGIGTVNFTQANIVNGSMRYLVTNNPLTLVPPASNNGITTVQGQIVLQTTAGEVTVSGRVLSPEGRGVGNALVTLTDQSNNVRSTITSARGFYQFTDVEPGRSYVVGVTSRKYIFSRQVIDLTDNIAGLDLYGELRKPKGTLTVSVDRPLRRT